MSFLEIAEAANDAVEGPERSAWEHACELSK